MNARYLRNWKVGPLTNFRKKSNSEKVFIILSTVYILLNFRNIFYGYPIFDTYDSPAYFDFTLYPSLRMQLVTIIYSTLVDETLIVIFQVLISVFSFIYLAHKLFNIFANKINGIFAVIMTYFLGFSSVVTEQNYKLLSESLNNSALTLLFGALVGYIKNVTFKNYVKVILAILFLAGTKAVSSISILVFFVLFLLLINLPKNNQRKFWVVTYIALSINIFFVLTATSTDFSKVYTTSSIINERIWKNSEWKNDAINNGFPLESRQIWLNFKESNKGLPPDMAVISSAEFKIWWVKEGENYLYDFMSRNLDYTFVGPICLPCLEDKYTFRETILSGWSQGTDDFRNVPQLKKLQTSRTFFWPERPEYAYIVILIFLFTLVIYNFLLLSRPTGIDMSHSKVITLFLFYILIYSYISWWLGSKENDMARHQLNSALGIRILSIYLIFLIIDTIIRKIGRSKLLQH